MSQSPEPEINANQRWYDGITRYQWTVLIIALLGWVFDIFEGQIFVASMKEAMPSLSDPGTPDGQIKFYNNVALAAFLLGGSFGGILFGILSDKIGRKRTMTATILFYSVFTAISAFSQQWWHLAGLRFFVAMGVGGEWAVASAFVAEVFPKRARPYVGSIFHASGTLGTYLATAAGAFLIGNVALMAWCRDSSPDWIASFVDPTSLPWRLGFALGVIPSLLIIWVRASLREPDSWQAARKRVGEGAASKKMGSLLEIFRGSLLRSTLVGLVLSTVGMATFWAVHVYGKDVMYAAAEAQFIAQGDLVPDSDQPPDDQITGALKRWEMLGMFLVTTGLLIGQLAFGPICRRIGRRPTFLFYQAGAFLIAVLVFQVMWRDGFRDLLASVHVSIFWVLYVVLPIFGFLTAGMHAGYAIYFPELYPTRLRGTGAGFCFNAGRLVAAPALLGVGILQSRYGFTLNEAASLLSSLYLVGVAVLIFAPETRDLELPE